VSRRAHTLGVLLAVALSCTIVVPLVPAGATGADAPGVTPDTLQWTRCGGGFQCATLPVPVDYADPAAGTIDLALTRRRADDRANRIGSLVVNYGGPGDAGTETLRQTAAFLPAAVRRYFDVVSFDPRGVGASRPVRCVDDATFERAWSEDPTPNGPADLPGFYDGTASSVDLVAECLNTNGDYLARLGSRNVARDLDRLRAAVGDDRLTYVGYSYGTLIGALYAQEFPQNVRALVLDSAVDLSSTMTEEQRDNTAGFEQALDEFLDDCAKDRGCVFHSGGDPRTALEQLRARFEQGVRIDGGDGERTVGVSEFYTALVAALYSREDWPFLAEGLQSAARHDDGTTLLLLNDFYAGRQDDGTYSNFQQVLGVIVCDDDAEPLVSFDDFRATYDQLSAEFPFFGPLFGSGPAGCDPRLPQPHADEQVGDVRVADAPPVLVIGNTRDPATPYVGAKDLHDRIEGSRLLTVDNTGHGSYATGNRCVDRIVNRYLVSGKAPTRDPRC
jgi:pimeloyl-ACP methyl ester carboxylesterase